MSCSIDVGYMEMASAASPESTRASSVGVPADAAHEVERASVPGSVMPKTGPSTRSPSRHSRGSAGDPPDRPIRRQLEQVPAALEVDAEAPRARRRGLRRRASVRRARAASGPRRRQAPEVADDAVVRQDLELIGGEEDGGKPLVLARSMPPDRRPRSSAAARRAPAERWWPSAT